jgi:peptide/nickel transport system substrate-binding protein
MNIRKKALVVFSLMIVASMVLAACAPAEPEQIVTTVEVPVPGEEVVQTVEVTVPVEVTQIVEVTPTPVPTTRMGAWLDEVVFSVIATGSEVTQLTAGAIDIYASQLSSATLPEIEAAGLPRSSSNGLFYELTYNPVGPVFEESTGALNPFSSARVREAMNWLVDRDFINQEVYAGGALAKFSSLTTQFPDYADQADVMRRIENKYAYNKEMATQVITEEMEAMGAENVGGQWQFNGEPVTLIFLIRTDSDGTRVPIGDYVANELESIGFVVDRQYKTSSEASPLWVAGNPADGLWHLYTGAWSATVIDRDQGDNFQFYCSPASAYAFSPLWQAYTPSEEFLTLADDLAFNRFTNLDDRKAAMARILELENVECYRTWLIDGKGFSPYNANVSTSFDLAAGIDGSQIWPYNLRFNDREGGRMNWGQPDLFVDPWNPVAGSNWAFDGSMQRGTMTNSSLMADPFTGLYHPLRLESAAITVEEGTPMGSTLDWVTVETAPSIEVPGDAWVDWDAENQVFITLDEKLAAAEEAAATEPAATDEAGAEEGPDPRVAKTKTVLTYPADLFEIVKWHDGSNMSPADFIMRLIFIFDQAKEASPIFDESQAPNLDSFLSVFKGMRVVSTDPYVFEFYTDQFQLDAEVHAFTADYWPNYVYGEAPWHTIAIAALAEENGELAFSADKADGAGIEWTSFIGGPSLEILNTYLTQATEQSYIPYAPTMSQFITPEEAATRYANLAAWYADRGHFWVGTGVYTLGKVFLTEKTGTLLRNPDYPDLANRWLVFGEPRIAEVELDGPGQVTIGQEAVYDVFVTFNGEPYPADDIKEVKVLLYDATGEVVYTALADVSSDGQYTATLPADVTSNLEAGANRLEVAVVPLVVAVPTFASVEFVTAP